MRIINCLLVLSIFITGLYLVTPIMACSGCQVCNEEVCVWDYELQKNVCHMEYVTGDACGQTNGGCPSGAYACSRGCCAIGSGGGSGTSGPGCINRSVDCPAGATISLGQPVFTDCRMQWGGQYCNGPGTAQRTTGCCSGFHPADGETPYDTCDNPEYTTYNCCSAGTTEQCTTTYTSYTATEPGIIYTWNPQSVCVMHGGGTATSSYNSNCRNIRYDGETINVCDVTATCSKPVTTCTCVSNCTATAPTNLSITSGSIAGTTAMMTWTPASGAGVGTNQLIYVGTDSTEVASRCPGNAGRTPCAYTGSVASNISSKEVVGLTAQTQYYFMVVNYKNSGCSKDVVTAFTTPQSTGTIAGTVYLDTFNTCSTSAPTMDNVSVVLDGVTTDVSGPAGAYSFPALLNSSHTLSVSLPSGYLCSNGADCGGNSCAVSGIVSPFPSRNFFLTLNRSAWWQAEGAGIYAGSSAGGTTISSTIPGSVSASNRYLVLPGAGGTPALVMRATGNDPSVGEGSVNSNSWSTRASYKGKKMDYQYFASQMGVMKNEVSDWGGNGLNQQSSDDRDFWYMKPSGGPASVTSTWLVDSNDKYVVFVDGDLDIDANITVQPGGFLAFVVNGNISVGTGVTSLQGIFIADTDFITESAYISGSQNDVALDVEGTVVAWSTTSFGRNLGTGNVLTPAEKFSYRPDFLINMPDKMKAFALEWTEVTAGTIEN